MPSREEKRWQHHESAKALRKVRKQIKRNRKAKRVRRRDWLPDSFDDIEMLYDVDAPGSERVMPRGERERRQAIWSTALAALEKEPEDATSCAQEKDGHQGIVVDVSSSLCRVELEGRTLICGVRGSLSAEDTGYTNVVAAGDRVIVSEDSSDRGVVEAVLPRKSVLARPDVFYTHLRQVIVANADQLLIVASWRDPALWPELIDRYIIASERSCLSPVLCINKVDLAKDVSACRARVQPYVDLGYAVLYTSATEDYGISQLRETLRGSTTVLAGLSGVGKSSLLTAVQPDLQLRTSLVSERRHEGRHTTSQVNLLELEAGTRVVDTPGIREFGLSELRQAELARFYPEILAVEADCRFGDCSHTHEPGCAVRIAAQQGRVSAMRYHSYRAILRSLPA